MTSATYFPEHRHQLALTLIRRERLLPDNVNAEVDVQMGGRVGLRDIIAHGEEPAAYALLDAAEILGLRKPGDLEALMQADEGQLVARHDVLASGRRGRKLIAPITGRIVYIGEGRVIMQHTPTPIELEAGLSGAVVEIKPGRGAVIESYGAVLQGVWGNGRRAIGKLATEPDEGIESIVSDAIDIQYRGAVMVTRKPLVQMTLTVIEEQGFAGVIAPSIDGALAEAVLALPAAILLTEGFGSNRMASHHYTFLDELDGRQATLDAVTPAPMQAVRPEVIINVPLQQGARPAPPALNIALTAGTRVQLHREGGVVVGEIIDLPKTPILLDNGLRVAGAQVGLASGERLTVPLANLEVFG